MADDHPNGFLKLKRAPIGKRDAGLRIDDFNEIWKPKWDTTHLREQGMRCMDCGVPTCMGGCPIGNIIPDWNDLVSRNHWQAALSRLHATNNFPEFTGYTCPAPCEPACVLSINDSPVAIKSIERAIVDRGWEQGWIVPEPPHSRSGKRVAVVGSGPAGLAAAQQLNRAGHEVTVFERDDRIGGLMVYGIPDFKFAKLQVDRRVDQMSKEGVIFKTSVEIGKDLTLNQLREEFDAVCLALGAQLPRDVRVPGRELEGIHFAMKFLMGENKHQSGRLNEAPISAAGKNVVVLGGGDTGADCVATSHRQGAKEVTQISINFQYPTTRPANNPWPEYPKTYVRTYAIEEGGIEQFSADATAFLDENGDGVVDILVVDRVEWTYEDRGGKPVRVGRKIVEEGVRIPADLVLIAIGFKGTEAGPFADTGLELTDWGTFKTDENMMTNIPGVFASGDARRGQSIVVWAIGEGRDAAVCIDKYLMGESKLPKSLRTRNAPIGRI